MKQLGPIALVVLLLLGAAAYYNQQGQAVAHPVPVPEPGVSLTNPVPSVPEAPLALPRMDGVDHGTLTLKSAVSHGYLVPSNNGELYAAVDIRATQAQSSTRSPLNVSLVIDRSGSMGVDAMRQAREAAKDFIDRLDGRDRVSVVSFSRDVRVDYPSDFVTPENRARMHRAIDGITASGATNIDGGYEAGFRQVQRWRNRENVNRVVLFTDGVPNVGKTSAPELTAMARGYLAQGVSLTTIGFGVHYDERLMASMADEGGGNYYFINNGAAMARVFSAELESLTRTVARATTLVVELGPEVDVEEVYGFPYQRTGQRLHLSLGEFYAGQSKNILLKLRSRAQRLGEVDVLKTSLAYDDLIHDSRASQHVAVHAVVTNDAGRVEEQINRDVIARVQQVQVAKSLEDAMELYEKGNTVQANEVINRGRANVQQAQRRYSLPQAISKRADALFGESEQAMKFNEASSSSGREVIIERRARSRSIQLESANY